MELMYLSCELIFFNALDSVQLLSRYYIDYIVVTYVFQAVKSMYVKVIQNIMQNMMHIKLLLPDQGKLH